MEVIEQRREMMAQGTLDMDWAEGLDGSQFVQLSPAGSIVEFVDEHPHCRENQWGKRVWDWSVRELDEGLHEIGSAVLSTASVRLKRALAQHLPLAGKIFRISRSGERMETRYSVQRIEGKALV